MKEEILLRLRSPDTPIEEYRRITDQLSSILADESEGIVTNKTVTLISILRSGLAMLPPFLRVYQKAKVGFLGISRNELTFVPTIYYSKLPSFQKDETILILEQQFPPENFSPPHHEMVIV